MLAVNFKPFPLLYTERLLFRQLATEDAEEIFSLRSSDTVNQFLGRTQYRTRQEAGAFITRINRAVMNNESIYWAISLENDPKLVGTICLWNIQPENYRAEIGYELIPDYWGRGIMKEAIPRIIDYGFKTMGLHSIEADIHPENFRSVRNLEQIGFVKEGHFKESICINGRFIDRIVYSLVNSEKN